MADMAGRSLLLDGRPVATAAAPNEPAAPQPRAPLRLTDLDDDTFQLVAAAAWTGDPGGGLFGACRRGRAVGTAGVRGVTIKWCAACVRDHVSDPGVGTGPERVRVRHPQGLAAHVDAAMALLDRASGLQALTLADVNSGDRLWCGAATTPSARAAVWRCVGAAAAACRLVSLAVRGTAATVALPVLASAAAAAVSAVSGLV